MGRRRVAVRIPGRLFWAVPLAALLAGGCITGRCIPPKELTYKVLRDDDVSKGKATTVVLEVLNRSANFMLVDRITGDHLPDWAPTSLLSPEPGALERAADGTSYNYNPAAQQETPPLFSRGLIPPGKRLKMGVTVVPGNEELFFRVHYRGLNSKEASTHLWFPEVVDGKPSPGRFVRWAEAQLTEVAAQSGEKADERSSLLGVILVDETWPGTAAPCHVDLPYKFSLAE